MLEASLTLLSTLLSLREVWLLWESWIHWTTPRFLAANLQTQPSSVTQALTTGFQNSRVQVFTAYSSWRQIQLTTSMRRSTTSKTISILHSVNSTLYKVKSGPETSKATSVSSSCIVAIGKQSLTFFSRLWLHGWHQPARDHRLYK